MHFYQFLLLFLKLENFSLEWMKLVFYIYHKESFPIKQKTQSTSQVDESRRKAIKDAKEFQQLVGSLIYLTITRTEIAYSVGNCFLVHAVSKKLTSRCSKANSSLCERLTRLWSYIQRHEKFMLNGFTKVDWVGDTTERHSTSRYCFITGLVMISWYSKKQPVVNYLALKLSTQLRLWLHKMYVVKEMNRRDDVQS